MPLSKIESASLETAIAAVDLAYTGTLTGGTGVVNLGSGQVYKDASGNVGIGTSSPASKLEVSGSGTLELARFATTTDNTPSIGIYSNGAIRAKLRASSAETALLSQGATPLLLGTNDTERARITTSGYLKVSSDGTYLDSTGLYHELRGGVANGYTLILTCPAATPLSAYIQDWRFSASAPNNGSARFWNATDNSATRGYFLSNGGLANYQANNGNLSDRREKTNFAPAKSYLDTICAIPVQTFNYIDQNLEEDAGLTLGVVAQDVQAVAPELVTESNWGTEEEPKMRLSLYQTDLQYALMKCIQEQQTLITALTARITALEAK